MIVLSVFIIFYGILFAWFPIINCQNWLLGKLLPLDYNKNQIPLENGLNNTDTLELNATIVLHSFAVHEKSQSIKVEMSLCLNWSDSRIQRLNLSSSALSFNVTQESAQIKLTKLSVLWIPQVYFRNALSAKIVNTVNNIEYARVWPERKLLQLCTRLSVSFLCRMSVHNFPFDEHYCDFQLQSFGKFSQHLSIQMHPMKSVKGNSRFRVPNTYVGKCEDIRADEFDFQTLAQPNGTSSNVGSCAFAGVRLVRNISYYVVRYFFPSFLMVLTGIASFWIPTSAWPARIILTAIVLLTMIALSHSAYREVPSGQVVALYWWLWCCQFIVYMCLIEFAFAVAWLQFINEKKAAYKVNKPSPDGYYFGSNNWYKRCGTLCDQMINMVFGPIDHYRDPFAHNKIDYAARILFPVLVVVFVLIYIVSTISPWANKWL